MVKRRAGRCRDRRKGCVLCKPQKHGLEPAGKRGDIVAEVVAMTDVREFVGARWHCNREGMDKLLKPGDYLAS